MKTASPQLLLETANLAEQYLTSLEQRRLTPSGDALEKLRQLDTPVPEQPTAADKVIGLLHELGSPATVASAGGRYFGFVVGGSLPAALAANWLNSTWDQNACIKVLSPVSAALERITGRWLVELLGLPQDTHTSFVTCTTTANVTALAAARHYLLQRQGWDVEADGLFGAPPLKVVAGEEAHATLFRGLALLGLGKDRVTSVPVDGGGRMRADRLPPLDESTIICIQAGNVNTGAFDPAARICAAAKDAGAWVHVDGAFGLWAAASPNTAHLAQGFAGADSWATDGHKWLNVPYDSGLAFVRNREALRSALSFTASYLMQANEGDPMDYTLEGSRRARATEIWAALKSLGRSGLAAMIDEHCRFAKMFAEGLAQAGFQILNDVQLNQVLVAFGDAEKTRRVIEAIQDEGTCWASGTRWQDKTAMRISISSWATTEADVEKSLQAMIRIARGAG